VGERCLGGERSPLLLRHPGGRGERVQRDDHAELVLASPGERLLERYQLGVVKPAIGRRPRGDRDGELDVVEPVPGDPRHVFLVEPGRGVGVRDPRLALIVCMVVGEPVAHRHTVRERWHGSGGRSVPGVRRSTRDEHDQHGGRDPKS
jgi:hypothetical protein